MLQRVEPGREGVHFDIETDDVAAEVARLKRLGEQALAGRRERSLFSAADIQMSFPVEAYRARGGLDSKHPRLMHFLQTIHARPAYRRAIERGGEYALMK